MTAVNIMSLGENKPRGKANEKALEKVGSPVSNAILWTSQA